MSTRLGLSAPVLAPLLPVTGTFALPFTAYLSLLSARVVRCRLQDKAYVGDSSASSSDRATDPLYLATRCHANFLENVPLAFVLSALVELNGGSRKALTGTMAALFAFRFLHVELGLASGMGLGRPIGYYGTMLTLGGMAGWAAYLVKGYWGF
ncbi:membrane-associated, eicosanoid/glutathione metabolism protein [Xylariaceae sp. FL0016]|nr:membrane-associated, eicosanoid/glutathione metabolism protein [Xylariaceae sp. FL0016]